MAGNRGRVVEVRADQFEKQSYQAGSEGIVATTSVPSTVVWQVPAGQPIEVALVRRQTATIDEGTAGQSVTLSPEAPQVDFMDDPVAGEYSADAFIAAYFDDSGDGNKDTLVTDSTTVQYNGTFVEDGDFVESFELDDTSGNAATKEVDIYVVQREGYAKLQKRSTGGIPQSLQTEDNITWAFSSPDDPDTDRQVTWDAKNSGLRGVVPPKFNLDVVYFDQTSPVALDEDPSNLKLAIPMRQRQLRDDEDPQELRRRVASAMAEN
ncbi:hypothetical protein [Halostella salina]|uniref:hypothetical protein n=1 Tax=Halostella salina TaxID=1547897 RepID=UPI000EF81386|nr:hypothetical protein [Halostella salina]